MNIRVGRTESFDIGRVGFPWKSVRPGENMGVLPVSPFHCNISADQNRLPILLCITYFITVRGLVWCMLAVS